MVPPPKKRRVAVSKLQANGDHHDDQHKLYIPPFLPVTVEERNQWQGFCEIESEPAFFNVMLKDFGVKGVKVQEVLGIDEDSLMSLPKPIYGMIFLFRYKTQGENKQEASCPDNVWFANQTHEFACATVSLLNIVNNIPGIDLGGPLQSFKDFTKDFTPALRGDQIGNFEFVKQIHNSFARKMDIMCIDLGLENRFDDRRKAVSRKPTKQHSKRKSTKVTAEEDYVDDDSAFHFIAYVPIDGDIWKLDGLDRQPEKIGCYDPGGEWLPVVKPALASRMVDYADGQIEFVLLSLVREPIVEYRANLAVNIKSLKAVQSRLDKVNPEWRVFISDGSGEDKALAEENSYAPVVDHDISHDSDAGAGIPEYLLERLCTECPSELMAMRRQLITSHTNLLRLISEEELSASEDERRAMERRQDYSLIIHRWLSMLAEKEGVIRELIGDCA